MPRLVCHGTIDDPETEIDGIFPFDHEDEWELVRGQSTQVFDPTYRLPYQAEQFKLTVEERTISFWACVIGGGKMAIFLP